MRKLLKVALKAVMWIALLVVVLLLALPLWIGPAASFAAARIGPKFTGTPVHLGRFALNPYTGRLEVGDLQVANPPDYSEANAVDLGSLTVDVAMTSVFAKKLRIEEVTLDGLKVHVAPSGGNLRKIAKAASGGDSAGKPDGDAVKDAAKAPEAEGEKSGGVEIDRVVLRNVSVKYLGAPISVPEIVIEGIGADSPEGASWADAWEAVSGPVAKAAGIVTGAVGDAAEAVGDAAGAVIDGAGSAIKEAGNAIKGLLK